MSIWRTRGESVGTADRMQEVRNSFLQDSSCVLPNMPPIVSDKVDVECGEQTWKEFSGLGYGTVSTPR